MDEKTFNLLKNYSEEISSLDRIQTPHGALSFLVQLIDSHRALRKMSQKTQAELHTDLDKIRKMVHDAEMSSTWVKWETLRHMTINQLIEAIGVEE
jgi:hypothetical protein